MAFPAGFTWGAATSSYQIEGSWDEDGKTPSIWDVFSAEPGKTYNGDTGRTACEHYHRYRDDVALMKEIGLPAYRFSVSWPRILPDGRGRINEKGLDFYSRLVDELLSAGIEPWCTLYHWDLPQILQERGGWINPEISDAFAEMTQAVAGKLGDRVKNWMTLNEPQCFLGMALLQGVQAPGLKLPMYEVIKGVHNALVAHGKSVDVLRSIGGKGFNIGIVPTTQTMIPASESPEDIEAARKATFCHTPVRPILWTLSLFTDPLFLGAYPKDLLAEIERYLPAGWQDDLPLISRDIDFCGINLYSGRRIKVDASGNPGPLPVPAGFPQTAIKWNVEPETLRWCPRFLYERYKKPIVIAENGLSFPDWVHLDGKVHDYGRIDYTRRYLLGLEKAIDDGAEIMGYFHWSLMDNFEWAEGFRERFGLIHVDFQTQKRTIKDSAYWYKEVIATNGKNLH